MFETHRTVIRSEIILKFLLTKHLQGLILYIETMRETSQAKTETKAMVNRTHQPADRNTEKSNRPSGIGGQEMSLVSMRKSRTGGVEVGSIGLGKMIQHGDMSARQRLVTFNEPDTVCLRRKPGFLETMRKEK